MECVSRFALCRHPGEGWGPGVNVRCAEDAKSRGLSCGKPQLQRLAKPSPINALNALRDGASCSDAMGCGG
jgi:hypothetical protein